MELETPTAYKKRLALFLSQPDILDEICSFVANGGTLTTMAELRDIRYGDIMNWIHADDDRDKRHRQATMDREEWYRDALMTELRKIAFTDIRKTANKDLDQIDENTSKSIAGVTYADDGTTIKAVKFYDKLKAIEMIGKQVGMFTEKHHHVVETYEDLINKVNGPDAN